jgi:hypothetical protein
MNAAVEPVQADPLPSLSHLVDLSAASMRELLAIQSTARLVGDVADAAAWQGRCREYGKRGQEKESQAGKLMIWLSDALGEVSFEAEKEAQRRTPTNSDERGTRLSMLAVATIDNDDPDIVAEFARELADHAAAEAKGA